MKTEYKKIEKNPKCLKCGLEAEYNLERKGFFYRYSCSLCWSCLQEHLKKLNVYLNRELF